MLTWNAVQNATNMILLLENEMYTLNIAGRQHCNINKSLALIRYFYK